MYAFQLKQQTEQKKQHHKLIWLNVQCNHDVNILSLRKYLDSFFY